MKINHCISIKCVSLFASAEIKKLLHMQKRNTCASIRYHLLVTAARLM